MAVGIAWKMVGLLSDHNTLILSRNPHINNTVYHLPSPYYEYIALIYTITGTRKIIWGDLEAQVITWIGKIYTKIG